MTGSRSANALSVIDASVWVAYYYREDRAHDQCFGWLSAALTNGERLSGPTLVIAEVAGAIARLSHREAALKAVEHLTSEIGLELVTIDEGRARQAAEVAATTSVRGADSIYLALARERGEVLISLDRQQRERGSGVVEVREP